MERQREGLAYEMAVRAIDEQRSSLDTVGTKAGLLLAALGLTSSSLAHFAFDKASGLPLPPLSLLGGLAASWAAAALLAACWPRRFLFAFKSTDVLDRAGHFAVPDEQLMSVSTRLLRGAFEKNDATIRKLYRLLHGAIVAIAVNTVTWTLVALFRKR